jgi:hypothetical protein
MELRTTALEPNRPLPLRLPGGRLRQVGGRTGDDGAPGTASASRMDRQAALRSAVGTVTWSTWLRGCSRGRNAPALPDLDRAFINPASVFEAPQDVVRHPLLTLDCKREILWRWAWDEYLLDLAAADGMAEGEPSRLSEVKSALRLVNTEWTPGPAAPAAFVIRYFRDEDTLAA